MSSFDNQNPVNTDVVLENQIAQVAEQTIQSTMERHNVTRAQIKPEFIQDAYDLARGKVEEQRERESDPIYQQLQSEREAHRLTQLQLDIIKQTRSNTANDKAPAISPEIVRARMGERDWMSLSDSGRLMACDINPNEVTAVVKEEIRTLFGGGDSHYASNFYKENKARYQRLKSISILLPHLLKK